MSIPYEVGIAINEEMNTLRKRSIFKGCIHEDANCSEIINAHSIQENRYLNKISDVGEVMCIDFGKRALSYGKKLDRVGKKKASTFTGFCKYHDNIIFKPIEEYDYEYANLEQNYLFAYRAFAMNYYERHCTYGFMKEHLRKITKLEEESKALKSDIVEYKEYFIDRMEKLRKSMNNNLNNKRFDRICTEILEWPKNFETAATTMYFVHRDREGNIINGLQGGLAPFFFTMIPQDDKTFILLSYLAKDKARYGFVKKQIVSKHLSEQMVLISNILALNVENFFISPRRWASIPENMRKLFIEICDSEYMPLPMGFYENLNIFC